jgi:hypothetical protein
VAHISNYFLRPFRSPKSDGLWFAKIHSMVARPFLILASLVACWVSADALAADLTMTMGGDISFNLSRQLPEALGVREYNGVVPFSRMTSDIARLIDGDLNFANLETVVSDRTDLISDPKTYAFETHPNAVRDLTSIGLNLFNIANNHSYDFGIDGALETRAQLDRLKMLAPFEYVGGGMNRLDAAKPVIFVKNGFRIAISAISILDDKYRATSTSPGFLNFLNESDYRLLLREMKRTKADLKILSIHYGHEGAIVLDPGQKDRVHRALSEGGVDLVIGHHPHMVRPVEVVDGKIIIYSLGNYLLAGASNIDGRGLGKDYGLFTRVHFVWDASAGKLRAQAIEALTLRNMNIHSHKSDPQTGAERIAFLNQLGLEQVGESRAPFRIREDGSGVYCLPTALPLTARAAGACSRL